MDSHAVERLADIRHRQLATLTRADDLARRARREARGKVMAAQPAVPAWRALLFRLRIAGRPLRSGHAGWPLRSGHAGRTR